MDLSSPAGREQVHDIAKAEYTHGHASPETLAAAYDASFRAHSEARSRSRLRGLGTPQAAARALEAAEAIARGGPNAEELGRQIAGHAPTQDHFRRTQPGTEAQRQLGARAQALAATQPEAPEYQAGSFEPPPYPDPAPDDR